LVGAAYVAGNGLYVRSDFARDRIERFLLAPADHHACAFARKYFRDGAADAAACACNDSDFSG
jgi:hypothetical protein